MTGESANHDAVGKKCSSFEETYSSCVEDPVYHSIQLILKKGQFAQITQNVILVECNDAEDFLRKPSLKKKKREKINIVSFWNHCPKRTSWSTVSCTWQTINGAEQCSPPPQSHVANKHI